MLLDVILFDELKIIPFCVSEPWMIAFSQSNNRTYHFNAATGTSTFDVPKEAIAPYKYVDSRLTVYKIVKIV